ncbi:MAG: type IV pilus assembly protein PilM [bacterium]|nr:type IV pilus assembly protein PilM [bacterium]
MFFDRRKTPLGLYLSDISLKMIQFTRKRGGFSVQAYSDTKIPKGAVAGDVLSDPKLLSKTIREAVDNPKFGKITTPYVIASVPETKSFVRVIQMPIVSEKEAEEAVPWEAEAYVPLPIGQVYLDWVILGQEGDKMTVLITACPKDYVDQFVSIIKEAKLIPLALEVESQATARSLVSGDVMGETILIADIDTLRTSLIIFDKGILQFTSSVPIAGNLFTESIAKALSLDMVLAEKMKRETGLEDVDGKPASPALPAGRQAGRETVKKALIPVVKNLVDEIINTIRFYEEHSAQDRKISRLLLSGGSSKLKHLPSFIHENLTHRAIAEHSLRSLPGLKVELGNPWGKILKAGQVPPLSREDSLSYATAIGLALREAE